MDPTSGSCRPYAPLAVLFAAMLTACSEPPPELMVITGNTMGTTYRISVFRPPSGLAEETLKPAVDSLLEEINDQMSTYRPDSELSRFNSSASTEWFDVSSNTLRVLDAAQRTSELSGGAFDITVGPLVNLWGFGPIDASELPPPQTAIDKARAHVGYEQLSLRASPPGVRKQRPDIYVDLSAIAKGFAIDEVATRLREKGATSFLVEIGGELKAGGHKNETPWRVAIERPVAGERSAQQVMRLEDAAIATSGDYRNFFESDEQRFSHTIDPRTGRPIAHALVSVSVVAEDAMHADAMATALLVMGPSDGFALAGDMGLAAYFITRNETGFNESMTPSFEVLLVEH